MDSKQACHITIISGAEKKATYPGKIDLPSYTRHNRTDMMFDWNAGSLQLFENIFGKYPILLNRIMNLIVDSEANFMRRTIDYKSSFLWEHTLQVAAMTLKICEMESRDPLAPVCTAFFHDAGKFLEGEYHQNEVPEEETAALAAEKIMNEAGIGKAVIEEILSALRSLYHQSKKMLPTADIVHDADFLVKFGNLGVANYFLKSSLRGKPLFLSFAESLSKELTYAASLTKNMRTPSGRIFAEEKSRKTKKYFDELMEEVNSLGIIQWKCHEIKFPCPAASNKNIELVLISPESCPDCGSGFSVRLDTEKGIKCETLQVVYACRNCDTPFKISFCLPELCSS